MQVDEDMTRKLARCHQVKTSDIKRSEITNSRKLARTLAQSYQEFHIN
jgi:hypothetical protein